MQMEILYRDEHILLCVKPVGVLSESGGLPELLQQELGGEVYCVHRLDRAVGGLMVYARSKKAAAGLSALISKRALEKHYLAVISGRPEAPEGSMRDLLYHDVAKNKSYVVSRPRGGVKEAELEYRLLESRAGLSLVRIGLKTGRSHQIRVQFASRAMPLAGDVKYGSTIREHPIALWSEALAFPHPVSGKPVSMSVPPPAKTPWSGFDILIQKEN